MNESWQEEFERVMQSLEVKPEPIEYRIHYDEFGRIVTCTMQQHPTGTQYLVVGKEEYDNYAKYRVNVEKKQLEKVAVHHGVSVQLKPSTQGFAVVRNHAGLLVEEDEQYSNIEYYEPNN